MNHSRGLGTALQKAEGVSPLGSSALNTPRPAIINTLRRGKPSGVWAEPSSIASGFERVILATL